MPPISAEELKTFAPFSNGALRDKKMALVFFPKGNTSQIV